MKAIISSWCRWITALMSGPQPQDLAVHLVADRGGALAGQDSAVGDVGDDEIAGIDFLED
jgi:hypothetical protein